MSKVEFRISKETLFILNSLERISQSIKMKPGGEIKVVSLDGSRYAEATIEEEFTNDIIIYDIREFIKSVEMFTDPIIEMNEDDPDFLTIKESDGSMSIRYQMGDDAIVKSWPKREIAMPTFEVDIKVTAAQFKKVFDASRVLKVKYVSFRCVDGKVYLCAFNARHGDGDETNSFSMELCELDSPNFNLFVDFDKLSILSNDDFQIELSSNKILRARSINHNITYVMGINTNSTFGTD